MSAAANVLGTVRSLWVEGLRVEPVAHEAAAVNCQVLPGHSGLKGCALSQ